LSGRTGELFDIQAEFELAGATQFGFRIRGATVTYNVGSSTLSVLGSNASLPTASNRIRLRILVDRSSLEVFGNDGAVAFTNHLAAGGNALETFAVGGNARAVSLEFHVLRGTWDPKDLAEAWRLSQNPTPLDAPRPFRSKTVRVFRKAFDVLGRAPSRTPIQDPE
jgi:hypothetical protein